MKVFFVSLGIAAALAVIVATIRQTGVTTGVGSAPASALRKSAAIDGKRAPVIVELFTSEGCSSCPPADAVLAQLQKEQPVREAEIIALSEHVDYWNYIGWADPFSSPAFSARQEAYSTAFRREGIYTPQMVVDGRSEFVGSNSYKAREAIAKAAREPKAVVEIAASGSENEKDRRAIRLKVSIRDVPPAQQGDFAEVIVAVTEDNLASSVSRGENAGRKLPHASVVREMRALGRIDPGANSFAGDTTVMIAEGWKRDDLRIVVFAQERAHKRVLGAAAIDLSN
jgi:hypothetical protein